MLTNSTKSWWTEYFHPRQEWLRVRWSTFRRCYGLEQPFNFKLAIPFLLSLAGFSLLVLVCAILLLSGTLFIGTERFYFFSYLGVLLLLAAATSRATRISLFILMWCTVEIVLGVATHVLKLNGLADSVLPANYFTQRPDTRFVYHPLLQLVPRPYSHEEQTFDLRNRSAPLFDNFPMNWEKLNGLKLTFVHNSLGIRGYELTPADLAKPLFFVYGGSTTYDYHVTQGRTWVELLQRELGDRYTTVNFGVPDYDTTHHLIQTAFYQTVKGKKPVCAIYYVGWNDLLNAHAQDLDPAYANAHLLRQLSAVRKGQMTATLYSPILKVILTRVRRWFDTLPEAPATSGKPTPGPDKQLERIFVDHITTIAAINASRNIRSVFIGQILNRDYLRIRPGEGNFGVPTISNASVWQLQTELNSHLRDAALTSGAAYIDPGIENFKSDDFSDQGHFLASGSKKFSVLVAGPIESYCGA